MNTKITELATPINTLLNPALATLKGYLLSIWNSAAGLIGTLPILSSTFAPFQAALDTLNKPLSGIVELFKQFHKDVEAIPAKISEIQKTLEALAEKLVKDITAAFSDFVNGILFDFLTTLMSINDEIRTMIGLLGEAAKAMAGVKPNRTHQCLSQSV